ncbi:MAG: hypothetical protein ACKOCM_04465 [Cyanobacteriota bacterium]
MVDTVAGWSEEEQTLAREAFEQAHGRAIARLISTIQARANTLNSAESVWQLHDFLSIERHTIEGRFAFQFDGILFVFASLVKEGLLELSELGGLDHQKLAKIKAMSCF